MSPDSSPWWLWKEKDTMIHSNVFSWALMIYTEAAARHHVTEYVDIEPNLDCSKRMGGSFKQRWWYLKLLLYLWHWTKRKSSRECATETWQQACRGNSLHLISKSVSEETTTDNTNTPRHYKCDEMKQTDETASVSSLPKETTMKQLLSIFCTQVFLFSLPGHLLLYSRIVLDMLST